MVTIIELPRRISKMILSQHWEIIARISYGHINY